MLYHKSRGIFGPVRKFFKAVFGFIYKILKVFNLQLALLVALIGVILFFAGVFEGKLALQTCFFVVFILSIVYAVVATVGKLLGLGEKKEKKKPRSKVEIVGVDKGEIKEEPQASLKQEKVIEEDKPREEKPKYYSVKQNPSYVMAEFSDRYELYLKVNGGLKRIRVDYKEK